MGTVTFATVSKVSALVRVTVAVVVTAKVAATVLAAIAIPVVDTVTAEARALHCGHCRGHGYVTQRL